MKNKGVKGMKHSGSGAVYGLGFLGALVFYVQQATDIGTFVVGIIKAIVWPAIVTYAALGYLKL